MPFKQIFISKTAAKANFVLKERKFTKDRIRLRLMNISPPFRPILRLLPPAPPLARTRHPARSGQLRRLVPSLGLPRHASQLLLLLPAIVAPCGIFDTFRCVTPRRDLYHVGVILCFFMDMMALCLIFFFLLFPYLF